MWSVESGVRKKYWEVPCASFVVLQSNPGNYPVQALHYKVSL